jgi:hypothetical protein
VANLVSYFHHTLEPSILKQLFHQEALARAEQSIWDPTNHEIITSTDLYIDQSGDICDNFDLLESIGAVQQEYQTTTPSGRALEIHKVQRLFTGDDCTSVSTLFTNADQSNTKMNGPLTVTTTDITQTHTSSLTNVNTETETRLNNFSDELQSIKQMLSMVLAKQPDQTVNITNEDNRMQVKFEKNLATKQKTGDSNESLCENQ